MKTKLSPLAWDELNNNFYIILSEFIGEKDTPLSKITAFHLAKFVESKTN